MKKTTMYTRLKDQYTQLTERIQKTTKQEQFYNNCATSLKSLGMGIAACAALGASTPAVAQYTPPTFVAHTGASNPLNALIRTGGTIENQDDKITFNPTFQNSLMYVPQYDTGTYQGNIVPFINLETRTYDTSQNTFYDPYSNASPGMKAFRGPKNQYLGIKNIAFADLDGDGVQDAITGSYSDVNYSYSLLGFNNINPEPCQYFKGTTFSTINTVYNEATNPLGFVNTTVFQSDAASNANTMREFATAFADLDGDGDLDCVGIEMGEIDIHNFVGKKNHVSYYENVGTPTNPQFVRHTTTNNIFAGANNILGTSDPGKWSPDLIDFDNDGDYDLFLHATYTETACIENTGTSTNPQFGGAGGFSNNHLFTNVIGMASSVGGKIVNLTVIDWDGDGDLDAFSRPSNEFGVCQDAIYLENIGPMMSSVSTVGKEIQTLGINPNPVTIDQVQFDQAMTGNVMISDLTGKQVLTQTIREESTLDISSLDNGLYIVTIETEEALYQEKIRVER